MYLKFPTSLDFPALATAICAELTEDRIEWDYENVYEWMLLDLPELDYSLNVSREHGLADVDDASLDRHADNDAELQKLVKRGPVYVFGWHRETSTLVNDLPDSLAQMLANRLAVDVHVHPGRIAIDQPDSPPTAVFKPDSGK